MGDQQNKQVSFREWMIDELVALNYCTHNEFDLEDLTVELLLEETLLDRRLLYDIEIGYERAMKERGVEPLWDLPAN